MSVYVQIIITLLPVSPHFVDCMGNMIMFVILKLLSRRLKDNRKSTKQKSYMNVEVHVHF